MGGEVNSTFHLLAVGSLSSVKDQAAAIRVLARLRTPDVILTIVGDGPLRSDLQALAEALGVADRVRLRGAVEHDELPALYHGADLHLLTSRHEAFGMVIAEAAACGIPSVGYARGILPELAAAGGGVAIPPGEASESELASAIDALLNDQLRLAHMRVAARGFAEERLSLSIMVNGVRDSAAVALRSA